MQAIFMVGEQRSGSNLLRLILNESGAIAGPHPPHILQRMMPLLSLYGDLSQESQFMKLIDDVCRLIELNPVPWDNIEFNRKDVRRRCRENNLIAVFGAVMDIYAEGHRTNAWICKSMQNIRWAKQINQYFANPKFVYLYRDPRDVTLSFTKAVIGDKHPYFIAQQWTELQELCLEQRNILGPTQFFSICYEQLTSNPEAIIRDLCEFLKIDFKPQMLNFHQSEEAKRSASQSQLWENLTKPIDASNSQKFKTEMTMEDIQIVESIAGNVMDSLGYERSLVAKGTEHIYSNNVIKEFQKVNEQRVNDKTSHIDPEDLRRRQIQLGFLSQIKALAC